MAAQSKRLWLEVKTIEHFLCILSTSHNWAFLGYKHTVLSSLPSRKEEGEGRLGTAETKLFYHWVVVF